MSLKFEVVASCLMNKKINISSHPLPGSIYM